MSLVDHSSLKGNKKSKWMEAVFGMVFISFFSFTESISKNQVKISESKPKFVGKRIKRALKERREWGFWNVCLLCCLGWDEDRIRESCIIWSDLYKMFDGET